MDEPAPVQAKYFDAIVNQWGTESTDPSKFIHEDLGIASYLMTLWKCEPRPLRFADVGCGNGLLVYILTKEGFHGTGFDLRRRKIWDFFDAQDGCQLKVNTISPSPSNLDQFSDYDWIIGNHSDELTPWMPVMARRSNAKMFLLPCCPFEFYGTYPTTVIKDLIKRLIATTAVSTLKPV